jgi:hypothetical protein
MCLKQQLDIIGLRFFSHNPHERNAIRYIVLSDLRSNRIPTVMEYIANIDINIINVQQAKTATMFKNKRGNF